MKKVGKRKYYFLDERIKFFRRLFVIIIMLVFIVGLLWYYKPSLYFTDKAGWYTDMGFEYFNIYKYQKAFEYANKALSLDPDKLKARELRAKIFIRWDRYYFAEKELGYLLADPSYLPSYYYYKGLLKLKQNSLNESITYFEKSIVEDPLFAPGYFYIGLVYLKKDDLDNALAYFNQGKVYVDQSTDEIGADIHVGLGFVYQKKGLYQKAEEEFKIAESLYPNAIDDFLRFFPIA